MFRQDKKKILVLCNYGMGLFQFRRELLQELLKKYEVNICFPHDEYVEKLEEIGCKYIPIEFNRRGKNPLSDINQLIKYKEIISNCRPDVILTYTIKPNVYGGIAAQKLHIPYITNVTGLGTAIENNGILSTIALKLYKMGLRKSSCVFFQNRNNQQVFINNKIVVRNTKIIPGSGVNLNVHQFEEYPSGTDEIRFLFVGRLMKDKGILELLEAFSGIEHPNVYLEIVGDSDHDIDQEIKKYKNNSNIVFYGRRFDIHPYMKNAHCIVLPSYHEGMSNVLLEAASTGRPVIATDVPGCRETFDDGISGLKCKPRSAESLYTAMTSFITLPYENKRDMGKNGRNKMEREFDRNIVINAYLEEINSVVVD